MPAKRTKKPKRGRPAYADPSQVRSIVRTIKITPAEDEAWRAAADLAEVSVNEWIRRQVERATRGHDCV